MNHETEYQLQEFRSIQHDLFDEDNKRYTGTRISDNEAERMLQLINQLESELIASQTSHPAQGTSEITVDDFEEAMYSSPDTDDMKVAAQKCYALAQKMGSFSQRHENDVKMQGSQVDWDGLEKEFNEIFINHSNNAAAITTRKNIFNWFKSQFSPNE